jgi:hypothetical protein
MRWLLHIAVRRSSLISRSDNRSDAVGFKPGVCLDTWPDSPPAGWNGTFFFRKKIKKHHAAAGDSAVHRVKRPI